MAVDSNLKNGNWHACREVVADKIQNINADGNTFVGQIFIPDTLGFVDYYEGSVPIDPDINVASVSAAGSATEITLAKPTIRTNISTMVIYKEDATGTVEITPAGLLGGTTITLDTIGDAVQLTFNGRAGAFGKWIITGNNGAVIA